MLATAHSRFSLVLLALLALPALAAPKLKVHLDRVLQPDYLGVNEVYHGFAFMPESEARGMTDADRAREFDRVSEMHLNVARTWFRPDWTNGDSLANPADWDSPKMRAFYKWLAAMQERHVDVALQAGWWFTRDTYFGLPSPDPARDLDRYPRWVSDAVHEIVEKRGFHNVKYLILFTEPTSYETGSVPKGETQWSYYVKMVHAIDQRLRADGRRNLVKLVGPNNSYGGKHLKEAAAELNDVLDIYSGHDYNKRDYDDWFAMCHAMAATVAATGKPFWLDELGKQDEMYRLGGDYGTYQAQIVAASINAGLQTSMQWLLFDQLYVAPIERGDGKDGFHLGVHRWGACKWPHDSIDDPTSCYPQWGVVRMMSKYLGGRDGTKTYVTEGSKDLKVSATSPHGRGLSVLVVNTSGKPQKFSIGVKGGKAPGPLHRYLYDPTQPLTAQPAADFPARVQDTIPAR
ncbi:MAG: hypothetical protein P4K98_12035, partial [Bryobacteraceae bacterium]|nr:hypothetical protein [Bryobacteraceae bacterium]